VVILGGRSSGGSGDKAGCSGRNGLSCGSSLHCLGIELGGFSQSGSSNPDVGCSGGQRAASVVQTLLFTLLRNQARPGSSAYCSRASSARALDGGPPRSLQALAAAA